MLEALAALIIISSIAAFALGLFRLVFVRGKRKGGIQIIAAAFATFLLSGVLIDDQKVGPDGFETRQDVRNAAAFGIDDPNTWLAKKSEILAGANATTEADKRQAISEAIEAERDRKRALEQEERRKAEAKRLAERRAREAEELAKQQEEQRLKDEAEAELRRKGFHCLSGWDGSHSTFKATVKAAMREPKSFEHIETAITPVDNSGFHNLRMQYRARNGFGGMNVGSAYARINTETCAAEVLSIE